MGMQRVLCPKPQSSGAISMFFFDTNGIVKLLDVNKLILKNLMMKKLNQISVILFLVVTMAATGCGVFGKSGGNKGCGCPGVNKKSVG